MAGLVLPHGYPLEEHFVTTQDGYILRLFRLGQKEPEPHSGTPQRRLHADSHHRHHHHHYHTDLITTTTTSNSASAPTSSEAFVFASGLEENEAPDDGATAAPVAAAATATASSGPAAAAAAAAPLLPAATPAGGQGRGQGQGQGRRRPVAFLQHPLMGSCVDYVVMGPGRSLGFLLADAGYDVWLTNVRGNRFSRNHTHLDPDGSPADVAAFWSFSWDQHAALDLPAALDFVAAATGVEKMAFVGYSQGTTIGLAALASQPRVAARLSAAVLLAPVAFVSRMTSPLFRLMATWRVERLFRALGLHEYGAHVPAASRLAASFCGAHPRPCAAYLHLLCGANPRPGGNLDPGLLPAIMHFLPSGTAVQNMAHWGQLVRSDNRTRLSHFDYGTDCSAKPGAGGGAGGSPPPRTGGQRSCNQEAYAGSPEAPNYPLARISTPLALFSGGHDSLADPADVEMLLKVLGPGGAVRLHHHEPDYGHLDFGVGSDAAERIYPRVLDFIANYAQ